MNKAKGQGRSKKAYNKNSISFNPEVKEIEEMADSWASDFASNNLRGHDAIDFAIHFKQWDSQVSSNRKVNDKECLTINYLIALLDKLISAYLKYDFNLDLSPINEQFTDESELNSARMLMRHFFNEQSKAALMAWIKCAQFGYAFVEYGINYEDNKTLNKIPTLTFYEDPTIAFWDKSAKNPNKEDGLYCGIKIKSSYDELVNAYPDINPIKFDLKENNEIIRCWFRKKELIDYVMIEGGSYKRLDCLSDDDKIYYENYADAKTKSSTKDCIYYSLIINKHKYIDCVKTPFEDLPLLYHNMQTRWSKTGEITYPFTYRFEDAQKFLNLGVAQLGTMLKKSSATKFLLTPSHLSTDEQIETANEISTRDGAILLGENRDGTGSGRDPIIIPAPEIPISMLESVKLGKVQIEDLGGSFIDTQQGGRVIVSGKAMETFSENTSLSENSVYMLSAQLTFLETICKFNQTVIPKIITETRLIPIKQQDGSTIHIGVNKELESGKILNDMRFISNCFLYEVSVGPSGEQQKRITLQNLMAYYSAPRTPDFEKTKDIFSKNLNISNAKEFEMRLSADMDQDLIDYSNGKISLETYLNKKSQQQQAAMQSQMQMAQAQAQMQAQTDPEAKANQVLADAETAKAAVDGYRAETDRYEAIAKAQEATLKASVDLTKATNQQMLGQAQHELNVTNSIIDSTIKAAADSIQNPVAAAAQRQQINQMAQNNQQSQPPEPPQPEQAQQQPLSQ